MRGSSQRHLETGTMKGNRFRREWVELQDLIRHSGRAQEGFLGQDIEKCRYNEKAFNGKAFNPTSWMGWDEDIAERRCWNSAPSLGSR